MCGDFVQFIMIGVRSEEKPNNDERNTEMCLYSIGPRALSSSVKEEAAV